jgi:uracil-DNA glycosylase
MKKLLSEIGDFTVCEEFLPNTLLPIIQGSAKSKILIIGQAPGQKVQDTSIPWDDRS